MRKFLSAVTSLAVASVLMFSCGGGGGGEVSTTVGSAGGVVADEFLKGLLVKVKGADCEKQPQLCAVTDKYGRFKIPGAAGKVLEVYYIHSGNCTVNIKLGEFKATGDKQVVTPLTLQRNEDVGGLVGLVLEAMAGYGANSTDIIWDLSSINDTACEAMVSDLCGKFADVLNATCSDVAENATVVSSINFASFSSLKEENPDAWNRLIDRFGGEESLREKISHCKYDTPEFAKLVSNGFLNLFNNEVTLSGTKEMDDEKEYWITFRPADSIFKLFTRPKKKRIQSRSVATPVIIGSTKLLNLSNLVSAGEFEDPSGKGIYVVGFGPDRGLNYYYLFLFYLNTDTQSIKNYLDLLRYTEKSNFILINTADSKGFVGAGFEEKLERPEFWLLGRIPITRFSELMKRYEQKLNSARSDSVSLNSVKTFKVNISVDGSGIDYSKATVDDLRNSILAWIKERYLMFTISGNDYTLMLSGWRGLFVNDSQAIVTKHEFSIKNDLYEIEGINRNYETDEYMVGYLGFGDTGYTLNVTDYSFDLRRNVVLTEEFTPDLIYYFTCHKKDREICSNVGKKVPFLVTGENQITLDLGNATIYYEGYGFSNFNLGGFYGYSPEKIPIIPIEN